MEIRGLADELGLDEEEVRGLVRTFLAASEQDLNAIEEAWTRHDAQGLCAGAHHIKGAAANLDLPLIAEAARSIEENARMGDPVGPAAEIAVIRGQLEMLRSSLGGEG